MSAQPEAGKANAAQSDAPQAAGAAQPERIWTVPNALSALRLAGVPFFLWLLLGPHADGWALLLIALSGITDWLDGVLARALNQQSRIGAMLDPAVDRLYILAALIGLVGRHIVPLWLVIVIVGRDVVLAAALAVLRRHGYGPPEVHYIGKAATFCLLYAFPLLLLGAHRWWASDVAHPVAWAFTIWGTALYLYAGAVYLTQVSGLIRSARRSPGQPT